MLPSLTGIGRLTAVSIDLMWLGMSSGPFLRVRIGAVLRRERFERVEQVDAARSDRHSPG